MSLMSLAKKIIMTPIGLQMKEFAPKAQEKYALK